MLSYPLEIVIAKSISSHFRWIHALKPEGLLRLSMLTTHIIYDRNRELPSDHSPNVNQFHFHFCQLMFPFGDPIAKEAKPDFKYEVNKTELELENLSILCARRDLVGSHRSAGKINGAHDSFVLAQSDINSQANGEFSLSDEVFQKIHADCLDNKRIQIFDLRFHNSLQRGEGFTVERSNRIDSEGNTAIKLRLKSDYDKGGALYVAEVVNRTSMSVSEYTEIMGCDPVLQYSKINYEDFEPTDLSFGEYLKRNREWLEG
jgi:hypothetical protein